MPHLKTEKLPLQTEPDLVHVRQRVKSHAQELRFSLVDQTKMVTAASELGRNAIVYGGGGTATIEIIELGGRQGLRVTFADSGPGIPDLARAMTDGYTSGRGMGLGLGGAKRLVNEFEIETTPGVGTRVTVTRWKT